ncbi:aspartyl protease family protein [Flavobacterium sasangense]|uniref:aspartyl protease family protein n=1 Tax=Flavobacterium sasangense TaxID=503361 RepID=UPI00047CE75C|nr:aspartyl protease family protein [Flavobacterium sasangense]
MRKIIQIVFLFMVTVTLQSQSNFNWKSKKDKIKIPFELTHNLIIVDVDFNGIPLKMIADTGAENSILFSFPENDSLVLHETDKIKIKGVGSGEMIDAYLSKKNKLKIKEYEDVNFELLLLPYQDISIINKIGIPINGILGSSFFESGLLEIDYSRNLLIFHKNKLKSNDSRIRKYKSNSIDFNERKPYIKIPIEINNKQNEYKLLFDSGLGDGLWLFENDTIKCETQFFNDILGVGLSGEIKGKRSRIEKINFPGLSLSKVLVSYPDSISFNQITIRADRNGSLGGDVLKRFNWFLDYENKVFYCKKNNLYSLPFEYNMSGIEVQHAGSQLVKELVRLETKNNQVNLNEFVFDNNDLRFAQKFELKPVFTIYAIRKDSPGDKAGLLVGDKIIKINNKMDYQLTIQSITDLFQSEDGKWITMIVDRAGIRFTVKFQLEKIL